MENYNSSNNNENVIMRLYNNPDTANTTTSLERIAATLEALTQKLQ